MINQILSAAEELLPAILAVVIFIIVYRTFEKRRTSKLKDFARGKLLQFSEKEEDEESEFVKPADLLGEAYNIMSGIVGGIRMTMYDYQRSPRNPKAPMDQTYLILEAEGLNLPAFSLSPKTTMHRIAGVAGYRDIPFPGRKDLSRRFLLRGKEVERIQALFGPSVLSLLEKDPRIYLEANGDTIMFLNKPGSLIPPSRIQVSKIQSFIDEGFALLHFLRESTGRVR